MREMKRNDKAHSSLGLDVHKNIFLSRVQVTNNIVTFFSSVIQYTGLAKKFVQIFLYHLTEKPE